MRFELVVLVLGFMFSASTLLMVPPLPAKLSVTATEEEKQQRTVLMKERQRCQVAVSHSKRVKGLDRTSESVAAVAASSIKTNNKRARGAERTAEEVEAVAGSNVVTHGKRSKGVERTTEEVDAVAASNDKRAKGVCLSLSCLITILLQLMCILLLHLRC